MKIKIKWSDDCQGKKDYDGEIVSVSTRYWPMGGGFLLLDQAGFHEGPDTIKPSAKSSILLCDGGPPNEEECLTLLEGNFKAETFEAVKEQVEEWVQTQMDRVEKALIAEFKK